MEWQCTKLVFYVINTLQRMLCRAKHNRLTGVVYVHNDNFSILEVRWR